MITKDKVKEMDCTEEITEEQMKKLRKYCSLMGDELGEVLYHIITIYDMYLPYISFGLKEMIITEMLDHLKWFEKCTYVEEWEETKTFKKEELVIKCY